VEEGEDVNDEAALLTFSKLVVKLLGLTVNTMDIALYLPP
jgi:hypothetical protein